MQWCNLDWKFFASFALLACSVSVCNKSSAADRITPLPALHAHLRAPINWCPALVARMPKINLSECRNAKFKATGAKSVKGFPIIARDLAAISSDKTPTKILLIGGIHGDEQTASAIVFKWLAQAQKPAARQFEWKIAPVVNPDGLLASKPMRMNAHGIDLNRNFPTPNWAKEAPEYWQKRTKNDPRRFPGKTPISEPESRWVYNTIEQFKPDVIISVHAPFGVLDMDGPATPPQRFGRLVFTPVGVYPGSLGNYSGVHKDIPVVTIELPNATAMPPDAEIERIWNDMLDWITQNVAAPNKIAKK